jgi:TolB protein
MTAEVMTLVGKVLTVIALIAGALPAAVPSAEAAQKSPGEILIARYMKSPRQYDLFAARPSGELRRITNTTTWETSARYSPDRSQIAFIREKRNERNRPEWFRLMVMDADGTNARVLADDAFTSVTWSPDGRFITYQNLADEMTQLYVVDVETGEQTLLDENEFIGTELTWDPDSTALVYYTNTPTAGDPYNLDLYSVAPDGSDMMRLTDAAADDISPSFSPDGTHIVFSTTRDDQYSGPDSGGPYSSELYVMDADGSNERQLTRTLSTWDEAPTWSPDGRWIVYERRYDDDIKTGPKADTDLILIQPDGSKKRLLTKNKGRGDIGAVWAPDGRWIAFDTSDGRFGSDVHMIHRSGRSRQPVSASGQPDYVSDWK